MAIPARQAIFRRKVGYIVAILALFIITTFFWRGVASPLTANVPLPYTVSAQANALELTELSAGDADLTGSAIRLMLTGSRGLALAILWYQSDELKKRHEWNKLEILVRTITKLTPHSPAPWDFQSWNIAYNVSVESDRVADKYFYIAKGLVLMAEGIRLNKDQPDMRNTMGFYYQNKFGISDEANTLRSLFQLSCIDPRDRDPSKMMAGNQVDMVEFEKFVTAHPQLARRLKEKLNLTPVGVVDFLRASRNIPSRYFDPATNNGRTGPKPLDDLEQFPSLPIAQPTSADDVKTQNSILDDSFDNFQAARSWMTYAQDPLPEATPQTEQFDRLEMQRKTGKRIPRKPVLVIFRHLPARAQSYLAERLEKEGWFDASGWEVDQDRTGGDRWFPPNKQVVVGKGVAWAKEPWTRAAELWKRHGISNGILLTDAEKQQLHEQAKLYRERYHLTERDAGKNILDDDVDAELKESFLAHRKLHYYEYNRGVGNFDHHYNRAVVESDDATIQARKLFFDAQRLRKAYEPERSIETFENAFEQWKKTLSKPLPEHQFFRNDMTTQEDSYELQIEYLDLIQVHRAAVLRPILTIDGLLSQGLAVSNGISPTTMPSGLFWSYTGAGKPLPFPIVGPLDQRAPDGFPWVDRNIANNVLSRMNRILETAEPVPPAPGAPAQERGATMQ